MGGALFELARDRGALDGVSDDMRAFARLLDDERSGLRRLFVNPAFQRRGAGARRFGGRGKGWDGAR